MNTLPFRIALNRRNRFICQFSWNHTALRQYSTAYPRPDPAVAAALYGGLGNDDPIYDFGKKDKRPKPSARRNAAPITRSSDKVDREKKAEKVKGTHKKLKRKNDKSEKKDESTSSEKSNGEPTVPTIQVERGKSATILSPSLTADEQDDKKEAKNRLLPITGTEIIELFREASAKKVKNTKVKLTDWLNVVQKLDEERKRQALKLEDFIGAMQSLDQSKKLENLLGFKSRENVKEGEMKGVDELVISIIEMIQLVRQEGKGKGLGRRIMKREGLGRENERTKEASKEVTKAKMSKKRKKLVSPKGDEQDLMGMKDEGKGILESKEPQNDAQPGKEKEHSATKFPVDSSTDIGDKMNSKETGKCAGKNLLKKAVRDGARSSVLQRKISDSDKKDLARKTPKKIKNTVSGHKVDKDTDGKFPRQAAHDKAHQSTSGETNLENTGNTEILFRRITLNFPTKDEDMAKGQETDKDASQKLLRKAVRNWAHPSISRKIKFDSTAEGLVDKMRVDTPKEVENTVGSQETGRDADENLPKEDLALGSHPSTHSKTKSGGPHTKNKNNLAQRLSKEMNDLKSRIRRRYKIHYRQANLAQNLRGGRKSPIQKCPSSRPITKLTSTHDQNVAASLTFSQLQGHKSLKIALAPSALEENPIQDKKKKGEKAMVEQISARQLEIAPLAVDQPPVPTLSYGLDRVLFNPGVYHLQDPRSQVYNFDPYLQKIMPISEFDFNALKEYITSSKDRSLEELARNHGKRYVGSSSSMTGALAHFHFLFSQWRDINTSMMSRQFPDALKSFSLIQRAPSAIILNWRNGTYAIDADKEFASSSVLSMLGKSMEKLLTLNTEDFERYRKGNSDKISSEERNAPESYHYCCMGDVLMRSQLDAFDARLPGTGMFDLKTRAVVSVRMDTRNYQENSSYEIKGRFGAYESYEREYYDMIRAAFLKYSLQVRMGRMDGIFVAFHNTDRIFGFQYISLAEMDLALHGQEDTRIGDQEFKLSIDLLNKILDKATKKYPEQSLRIHFETRESATPFMYIAAEPVTEDQVKYVQTRNDAKIKEFENNILGLNKSSNLSDDEAWDSIRAEIQKTMDQDEKSIDEGDAEVVSHTNEEISTSPTDALKIHDSKTIMDAGNDDTGSPIAVSGGNTGLNDKESEDIVNEIKEEEEYEEEEEDDDDDNEESANAGELKIVEDELEDENDRVTLQEKDEMNEEEDEIVGEDDEPEAVERGETEETPEQEDPENEAVDLMNNAKIGPTRLGQKTAGVESAQNPEVITDVEDMNQKGVLKADGSSDLGLAEENADILKESAVLSDTKRQDESETFDADVPFFEQIDSERPIVKSSNEVLLMTLTIRNKVNNLYQKRPTSLQAGDDWSVQYSLTEESKQERAWALYQAIQARRKKQLDQEEDDSKTTVDYYIKKMRSLSAQGKKWREEQDQKYNGSPIVVWGQSSAERRASDASPKASPGARQG